MTPDQLAERIMDRIEKDQAIHKSSIIDELQLACAPAAKPTAKKFSHGMLWEDLEAETHIERLGGKK